MSVNTQDESAQLLRSLLRRELAAKLCGLIAVAATAFVAKGK